MATGTVITGDIVNSTSLPKGNFTKLVRLINSLSTPYQTELYRGDSFQIYLRDNDQALLLLLKIRTAAKRIMPSTGAATDIRAAIGIGNITGPVRTLNTATGQPFLLSGRSLDNLKEADRLAIQSTNEKANCAFRVIARFIDYIFTGITAKQAAVIFELLHDRNQTDTAKKLAKSQATINRQAHAAGWPEIERLLREYQTTIHEFNLQ